MILRLFAFVVLAALVGGGYLYWKNNPSLIPPRNLGEAREQLQDAGVTGAVKTAIALHRSLKPLGIEVSTENKVVTLRGDVPQEELKQAAEHVTASVPDVKQVVNHLRVVSRAGPTTATNGDGRTFGEKLDDEALEVQAKLAFSLNRNLKDARIDVEAWKRQLRISGEVSEEQKKLALATARDIQNVIAVTDRLTVRK